MGARLSRVKVRETGPPETNHEIPIEMSNPITPESSDINPREVQFVATAHENVLLYSKYYIGAVLAYWLQCQKKEDREKLKRYLIRTINGTDPDMEIPWSFTFFNDRDTPPRNPESEFMPPPYRD